MISYASLAGHYDELMRDVDYEAVADFYENAIKRSGNVSSVLDAACGTGTLACILAKRGYDITAADMSAEMLAVAWEKLSAVAAESPPLLLNQSLDELDLYGTVDAAVCSLDGLNYLDREELAEAVRRIFLFLEPGGTFAFDINTPEKFADMDGQMYVDETDGVYCVWRTDVEEDEGVCVYSVDIFSQQDGNLWRRENEEHFEYVYTKSEMLGILSVAGFEDIFVQPAPFDAGRDGKVYRLCFTAAKPGKFHKK